MMIPAILPIPSIGAAQAAGAGVAPSAATGAGTVPSASFQNLLGQAIDSLNGVTNNATNVSLQAAAGTASVADATVASTEADLATQLASALTGKAINALNTIMNMSL